MAFLSFVFFCKLRECYTEEATSASYFCLFLLFCYCLPGPANLPSSCCASGLAGNDNKELRVSRKHLWVKENMSRFETGLKMFSRASFVLCCRSLLTHWLNSCWADWPAQAGSNRKAGRGKSMKLKLLLLYSIHATYGRIQMSEMPKRLKLTSLRPGGRWKSAAL